MSATLLENYLTFLAEGGARLAKAAPDVSHRLVAPGLDPDAERLLEGIAYLAQLVESKFEARLPVLIHVTFDLFFPHFLRPVPSVTILQVDGPPGLRLSRGAQVESIEVSGTACRFTTTYDVAISPLKIRGVSWRARALTVSFEAPKEPVDDALRIYINTAERTTGDQIYESLHTALERIELVDGAGEARGEAPELEVRPVGLSQEESFWPSEDDHRRFQLIQEFFTLPEKFMFFEVRGLERARARLCPGSERVGLRFHFSAPAPRALELTPTELRLNCAPAVNLYEHDAVPLQLTRTDTQVVVRPEGPLGHHLLHEVLEVLTHGPGHEARYPLACELNSSSKLDRMAQVFTLGPQTRMMLLDDDPARLPEQRTLSVRLRCLNGDLPARLQEGHIRYPLDAPEGVSIKNITRPTRWAAPPLGPRLRRALILHLSIARGHLDNVDALRGLLELYAFRALSEPDKARELEALKSALLKVETEAAKAYYEGDPIRGQRTTITLDGAAFREGGLYLLGGLINELIAMDAPINTFSELVLQEESQNRSYRWKRRLSRSWI